MSSSICAVLSLTSFLHKTEELVQKFFSLRIVINLVQLKIEKYIVIIFVEVPSFRSFQANTLFKLRDSNSDSQSRR